MGDFKTKYKYFRNMDKGIKVLDPKLKILLQEKKIDFLKMKEKKIDFEKLEKII